MPESSTKYRIAKNERIGDNPEWTWHSLPSGQVQEFDIETQAWPYVKDLKRADLNSEFDVITIPAGVDPDSCLPKN